MNTWMLGIQALVPLIVGMAAKLMMDVAVLKADVSNIKTNHLAHIYTSLERIEDKLDASGAKVDRKLDINVKKLDALEKKIDDAV